MLPALRKIGLTGFVLGAVVACADRIASPIASLEQIDSPVANAINPNFQSGPLLRRTKALSMNQWTTAVIYPSDKYQSIKIQDAGVKISFPPGAVSQPVRVWMVAHRGEFVTYEFFPHGLTFNVPIKIQQNLHSTTAYHNETVMSTLYGAYMAGGLADIDYESGTATLAEVFDVHYWDDQTEFTKTSPSVAKFYTTHFSGYTLASGNRPSSLGSN